MDADGDLLDRKPYSNEFLRFLESWGFLLYAIFLIIFISTYYGYMPFFVLNSLRYSSTGLLGKINFSSGRTLSQGEYIASCHGFSHRYCQPVHLTLSDGILKLCHGRSPFSYEATTCLWLSDAMKYKKKPSIFGQGSHKYRSMIADNFIIILNGNYEEIWRESLASNSILQDYVNTAVG